MSRRSKSRFDAVDGLLLLNKPAGLTSNQALQRVKHLLNARKAGHTGSLDPAATGMLPLCFGEATKVCAFLLDADKSYRVTAKLGIATDTGDADGTENATSDVPELPRDQWLAILEGFLGQSEQIPPMYSALKQGGKRLYELARKGEIVERKPRPIRIDAIELLEIAGTRLVFTVHCSKGTYIRTLVEDIAAKAGTVAHTVRLHRESVAEFQADDMIELSRVEAAAEESRAALRDSLLPPDAALQALPAIALDVAGGQRFTAGQSVSAVRYVAVSGLARVYGGAGEFLGVGELSDGGQVAPRRVFLTGEKNP
jgi:tRNA pseudouridine55 synthase